MTTEQVKTLIWSLPPKLREEVKAAILEAMRSAEAHENFMCMADETDVYAGDYGAWCDLCAPEEVKP